MRKASETLKEIASKTDKVILFHSASGKDSIALLDLCAPYFKEVVCVFMYVVKDLEHIRRYINYAERKYPNCHFVQVPHYALFSYIKTGYLGCKANPKQRQYSLAEITEKIRERTGIDWALFGFKQSDSMNRRVMLRTYRDEAICDASRKAYPLSHYKNGDVRRYICKRNLIPPESYGMGQSCGTDISDTDYLLFLREKFPEDLKKVFAKFPHAERNLFEYDYERAQKQ